MNKIDFIIEILEVMELDGHKLSWYLEDKYEAAEYILDKMEEYVIDNVI